MAFVRLPVSPADPRGGIAGPPDRVRRLRVSRELLCKDFERRHADARLSAKLEADPVNSIQARARYLDFSIALEAWMTSALSASMSIDAENAASDFGMSSRSFQRKLSEHNINYLELRNKVRTQIAKCLLGTTSMAITSIAIYLGYSETSAFSRHFRNTTGLSPSEFRFGLAPADKSSRGSWPSFS